MAVIGTAHVGADNRFTGEIAFCGVVGTFALETIPYPEGKKDKAPDYRVIFEGKGWGHTQECGAAWKRKAQDTGRAYLSITLDVPTSPAPVNFAAFEDKPGEWSLIWNRAREAA